MIYLVGGNKGGVGKSFTTKALIHYLSDFNPDKKIAVVDGDKSQLDILKSVLRDDLKATKSGIIVPVDHASAPTFVDLNQELGWGAVLDFIDDNRDCDVVINTPGAGIEALIQYSRIIGDNDLAEMGQQMITIWPIDRNIGSVVALKDFASAFPSRALAIVKNGHYGGEAQFRRYDQSEIKARITNAGAKTIYITDLADDAADIITDERLLLSEVADFNGAKRSQKNYVREWIDINRDAFAEIIIRDVPAETGAKKNRSSITPPEGGAVSPLNLGLVGLRFCGSIRGPMECFVIHTVGTSQREGKGRRGKHREVVPLVHVVHAIYRITLNPTTKTAHFVPSAIFLFALHPLRTT